MRPYDTAIAHSPLLPETYLVGDFEDTLTELGIRALAYGVEENETKGWPFDDTTEARCSCCGGSGHQIGEFLRWADPLEAA